MGRVDGKVALITGAARGQGRAHARLLAAEGASIIAVDACEDLPDSPYPLATKADLDETARIVEDLDQRIIARQADVRDQAALDAVVGEALAEFGKIDVVVCNAGVLTIAKMWEYTERAWQDVIDVNLTGTWHTIKATVPHMIEAGNGGSIIITSSLAGLKGFANTGPYTASKHGVLGIMRTLAQELGPHHIRVNSIHPTNVNTDMVHNDTVYALWRPDLEPGTITREQFDEVGSSVNVIPVPYVEPSDISEGVLWLASDATRYVTGVALPIDAGMYIK
jgi:(+)-trans-carveol dehydrogenase